MMYSCYKKRQKEVLNEPLLKLWNLLKVEDIYKCRHLVFCQHVLIKKGKSKPE